MERNNKFFLPLFCLNSFLPLSEITMHASKRAGRESERLTLRPSLCVNQRPPVTRGARRPGSAGGTCGPACPPRSPGPEHTGAGEGETSHARCFISGRTKRQPGSSGSRQKLKTTLFARNIHAREAPSPGDGGAVSAGLRASRAARGSGYSCGPGQGRAQRFIERQVP